jgi:hypothetical protein
MRPALCCALAVAAMGLAVPAGAAAQGAASFQAQLGAEGIAEPASVECTLNKGMLSCAVYGAEPPAGAQCSAGGAVLELRLGAAGRTTRGHVCVDEGAHEQGVLPADQAWRRGGFACAHGWLGQGLGRFGRVVCSNKAGYEFSVDAHGRVGTPTGPRRLWLALGDSYASGEGIPGTEVGAAGPDRECARATGRGTDAKAWSVGAYEQLRDRLGIGRLAFTACTGATTDDIPKQIEEAQVGVSGRAWDVVTVGIGGNNIDFAGVLFGCVTDIPSSWGEFDDSGCDESTEQLKRRVDMLTGGRDLADGEYEGDVTLPQALDQIAEVVEPGGDVIVTGYPQIVEEVARWDRWRRDLIGSCEFILAKDVGKLRSVAGYLNEQMAKAVQRADRKHKGDGTRFHWVDISGDPYEYSDDPGARHALCSRAPWLNGVTVSTWSGDIRGLRSFHPKQSGHTNTARVVADLMRGSVKAGDAPDTPPLARPSGGDEAPSGQTLLNYGDGRLRYKPTSLRHAGSGVACGSWKARDLTWRTWTANEATATGTLLHNPGDQGGCAGTPLQAVEARFRFYRPKTDCPIFQFAEEETVDEPRAVFTRVDVVAADPEIRNPWKTAPADGFQCQ